MRDSAAAYIAAQAIDPRIRYAMRILENEQMPLPETADVAARVGLSVFHFVRLFAAQLGQSPQDYGRSIVMRHAASRIRYSEDPIAVVAKDFGYAKQATFTKAFTRHHGVPPARWRVQVKAEIVPASGDGVRLESLPSYRCVVRRYLGPRALSVAQWADFVGRLPPHLLGRPRMGLAYDDPRITPPERIRHDCAVVVEPGETITGAMVDQGFELLESPVGLWAVADVAERTGVANGYRAILAGWLPRNPRYALEGDPFLERFCPVPEASERASVLTVCLRVRPIADEGDFNMRLPVP